jgi:hypothetical protein
MCNALGLNPPQGLLVRGRLHDGACCGRVTIPSERAAVDHVAGAQKDAKAELFAALCGDAEIATKIGGRLRTHGSVQPMRSGRLQSLQAELSTPRRV